MLDDLSHVRQLWRERWGDEFLAVHGVLYHPDALEGYVALDGEEWLGLITYSFSDCGCEIVSIDSLCENTGIGTALVDKVIIEARQKKCKRVFLTTTNDNLRALGFYQKRGFELALLRRNAVNESRKTKPNIPLIGGHGIPLRDEIELELLLNTIHAADPHPSLRKGEGAGNVP